MASQALTTGINLVIAPAGLPVTCTAACTLGFTPAGAASGPSMPATTPFTWPASGASLAGIQGVPAIPPGMTALYVNVAAGATLNYAS